MRRKTTPTPAPAYSPEQIMAHLRKTAFEQALATLRILKTLSEETSNLDPRRLEISDGLRVVRRALTDTGLDLVRPVIDQLKTLGTNPAAPENLVKLAPVPADAVNDASNQESAQTLG